MAEAARRLGEAGFRRLDPAAPWSLAPGDRRYAQRGEGCRQLGVEVYGGEFVQSGRLDNLASCHAALQALAQSVRRGPVRPTRGLVLYDLEEVGSQIAYLFDPVIDRFEERGVPRSLAIGILLLASGALVLGAAFVLIPAVQRELAPMGSPTTPPSWSSCCSPPRRGTAKRRPG